MEKEFKDGYLEIYPSQNESWYGQNLDIHIVTILKTITNNDITLDFSEAEFLAKTLNTIISYYKNLPKKYDNVIITSGRFLNCEGYICDIDICDNERPVVVKLYNTKEFEGCMYYTNFESIKKKVKI